MGELPTTGKRDERNLLIRVAIVTPCNYGDYQCGNEFSCKHDDDDADDRDFNSAHLESGEDDVNYDDISDHGCDGDIGDGDNDAEIHGVDGGGGAYYDNGRQEVIVVIVVPTTTTVADMANRMVMVMMVLVIIA